MRVCFFGTYEKKIHFNRIIINSLRKNNVEVIECHGSLIDDIEDKSNIFASSKISFFLKLLKIYFNLSISQFKIEKYDAIIVGYVGQYDIFVAKIFSWIFKKPLIYAPLLSLYDTFIEDRKKFAKNSLVSKLLFQMDRQACRLADLIFLDTETHALYFSQEFSIPISKFRHVWVSTDENVFFPGGKDKIVKNEKFTVLHFGKYIPLHGLEYIIDAAKILETYNDIIFIFIGSGQLYQECEDKIKCLSVKNVKIVPFIPEKDLVSYIRNADICLGIFGISGKAGRVIATKVYDSIAIGKAVITRDSKAMREVFTHEENIYLCKEASGQEIAKSILYLKQNNELRKKIEEGALKLFKEKFSWDVQGKNIINYIDEVIG